MIEIASLLEPISAESPCGADLSFSVEFDQIQEARRFEDPTLDQGEWVTAIKEANWPDVSARCKTLLHEKTKDIRLAVWLAESSAKTDSFSGLAQGLQLLSQLSEKFWDEIYPLPEDGDQELRIGILSWLLNRMLQLVRELPLTRSNRGESFNTIDNESGRALGLAIKRSPNDAEALSYGKITQEKFESARKDTPREFYVQQMKDIEACEAALNELGTVIDGKLGVNGPAFGTAKDGLAAVKNAMERFAREAGVFNDDASTQTADAGTTGATKNYSGPIQTREQALAQLRQVSDFFRRTEPHNPVAYLADQAAKWGGMSLHDWLRTVMKDQAALGHIEELLGVQAASNGSNDSSNG
jgi:type VI secretion system protein ImpA